jgi:hypothetical protein
MNMPSAYPGGTRRISTPGPGFSTQATGAGRVRGLWVAAEVPGPQSHRERAAYQADAAYGNDDRFDLGAQVADRADAPSANPWAT